MKKIIYRIIMILLIGIMLISSYFILKNKKEDSIQENIFEEITNIAEDSTENEENQIQEKINIKELYNTNNDIVGWVRIDNTNIDYPVMQTKNEPYYYLRRNFYKEYSQWGTPFLDEKCDIQDSDCLIIYGHHIQNSKMFGELNNYKKEEYYKNHKYIKFYTMTEKREYEIIAVFKTVAYTGFKYYEYNNFKDEREFEIFIEKCKKLSFYNIEKSINYGEKLIILSTCEYSQENGRLVVVAKEIL